MTIEQHRNPPQLQTLAALLPYPDPLPGVPQPNEAVLMMRAKRFIDSLAQAGYVICPKDAPVAPPAEPVNELTMNHFAVDIAQIANDRGFDAAQYLAALQLALSAAIITSYPPTAFQEVHYTIFQNLRQLLMLHAISLENKGKPN